MPMENRLEHATVTLNAKLLCHSWPLAEYAAGMRRCQLGRQAHFFSIRDTIDKQGLRTNKLTKPAGKITRCSTGGNNHIRSNDQHDGKDLERHPNQGQFGVPVAVWNSEIAMACNVPLRLVVNRCKTNTASSEGRPQPQQLDPVPAT